MNIRDIWNGTREQHAAGDNNLLSVVSSWQSNRPLAANDDYQRIADEGYTRNVIGYACVNEIASSASEPEMVCANYDQDRNITPLGPDHPLSMLLDRPNFDQDQFEFEEQLLTYYLIAGRAYVHKVRSLSGRVVQLRNLRPDRVQPVVTKSGMVIKYVYTVDGQPQDVDARDIMAVRKVHPLSDFQGLSPFTVAARDIDLDNAGADYMRAIFTNGGLARLLMKLKKRSDPAERETLRQQWAEKYSGTHGMGSLAVIDQDVDVEKISLTPDELELSGLFGKTESRICAAFGVPPILIAAKVGLDASTYSNYEQARRSFWQETLSPLYRKLSAKFTHSVASEFDAGLFCYFDLDGVEALRESQDKVSERARGEFKDGLLTRNEARERLGEEPVAGGDTFRSDMSSVDEPMTPQDAAPMSLRDQRAELLSIAESVRDSLHSGNGATA